MNLASALIHQIITHQDIETWGELRENYLPTEFKTLYRAISKHLDAYKELPSFDDLELSIREKHLQEKIYAIKALEVDVEASHLLEYLKNEAAQVIALDEIEKYIENSIAMSTAEETVEHLQGIITVIENNVEIVKDEENLRTIDLFDSEEELANYIPLGLNAEYDSVFKFSPEDYVLVGGQKGSGKSLTCMNVANYVRDVLGRSAIYYTIEMSTRPILQRHAAQSLDINARDLRFKNLTPLEWDKVAKWWADRYAGGEEYLAEFQEHRDFNVLHSNLKKLPLSDKRQLDVVYDSELSLGRLKSDLDVKFSKTNDYGVIVVDYINQVKRDVRGWRQGQYDWTEQIEVSKALKSIAQTYKCLVFSAYQTDDTGMARFSKGILDSCDAAFSLQSWEHDDACMTFTCQKMRNDELIDFTSEVNWSTLKIGPRSAINPAEKKAIKQKMMESEDVDDI